MSAIGLTRILKQDSPGETRAIAIDAAGLPWRSFHQRWDGQHDHARLGAVMPARLRADAQGQGGAFVELESGEDAFLAQKDRPSHLTQGQSFFVRIVSEQRRAKLARVKSVKAAGEPQDAFTAWLHSLPNHSALSITDDAESVEAAFQEALTGHVTIPGGGTLHIEHTRALTAMDIDTSGRQSKGSAGAKALSVNLAACEAAARQIALRDLGGAIVIDCLAPLNAGSNAKVRQHLSACFQRASTRHIEVLTPSRFGLMHAAIAWGQCPVSNTLLEADGWPTPETRLLDALRSVEREARASGAGLFKLALPKPVLSAYRDRRNACDLALKAYFGGRVTIEQTDGNTVEIIRL